MADADTPPLEDIRSTVTRMETRLAAAGRRTTRHLLALYEGLVPRFAKDLPSERERLLSRAAALMLIQAAEQDPHHGE